MATLKYCRDEMRKEVEERMRGYKGDWVKNVKNPYVVVGDEYDPSIVIIDKGGLGLDFVDREGGTCYLNSIGTHHLLQFLIDKQFNSNVVRNSKEITGGRDG